VSPAIPLGLASASLVARAEDLTARAVRAWSERWAQTAEVGAAASDLTTAIGGAHDGQLLVERVGAGSRVPVATLWWPAELEANLAHALYGAPSSSAVARGDSLAMRSARHLALELRRLLDQAWRIEGWLAEGEALDAATRAPTRWHALVDVRVTVAGATLVGRLPALRLQPGAVSGGAALLTRAQTLAAVATLPARATAVIGHADISVAELANLRCGDILLLDATLGDPLQIEVEGASSPLRAGLGLVGARRAVQFLSVSRP
jgi:flagellar motor switch/type III secretory pathway protein FliN